MSRYIRQTLLPEIGNEGQTILSRSKVLIVGTGGLGCPAALYLAGAGVGTIGLMDDDTVDLSNLHRQILFTQPDVGALKVVVAQQRLASFNPTIRIEAIPSRLTSENALEIIKPYDVVIDGTDNFSAKFLINDCAAKLQIPYIYGALARFEGQVAIFSAKESSCYRCLYPHAPAHHIPNCAEAGVLGSIAGIVGSIQATEAIKCLLSSCSPGLLPHFGRLYIWDTKTMESSHFQIPKRADCTVCSRPLLREPKHHIIVKEEAMTHCSCTSKSKLDPSQEIDASVLHKDDYFKRCRLIDIRTTEEWNEGHIVNAVHWPLSRLENGELPPIDSEKPCILYCRSGARSSRALELLGEKGIKNVKHLKHGILSWEGPLTR